MNESKQMQFNENQINGLKAGLSQVAQGCLTLIKVLTMSQIPETEKYPHGRDGDREDLAKPKKED